VVALAAVGCGKGGDESDEDRSWDQPPNPAAFEATKVEVGVDDETGEITVTVTTEPGAGVNFQRDRVGREVTVETVIQIRATDGTAVLKARFNDLVKMGAEVDLPVLVNSKSGRREFALKVKPPTPPILSFEPEATESRPGDPHYFTCGFGELRPKGAPAVKLCDRRMTAWLKPDDWTIRFAVEAPGAESVTVAGVRHAISGGKASVAVDLGPVIAATPLDKLFGASMTEARLQLPIAVELSRGESVTTTLELKTNRIFHMLDRADRGGLRLPGESVKPAGRRTMIVMLPRGTLSDVVFGPAPTLGEVDLVALDRSTSRTVGRCRYNDGSVEDQVVTNVKGVVVERLSGRKLGERTIPAPRHPGCAGALR
jgi:hypothetical protein